MRRRTETLLGLVVGLVLSATLVATLTTAQQPAAAGNRKVFKNSVIELQVANLAAHALVLNEPVVDHSKDKMDVLFSLSMPKQAEDKLAEKVLKGKTVTAKELADNYAPKPEDVKRLTDWLQAEGFAITHKSSDQTSIYARATVGQIANSLQVKMVRVTAPNGMTYNAAQNAPSLPREVGDGVQAIIGLQPFRQFIKQNRPFRPGAPAGPSPAIANAPPYLVKEILKAYKADGLSASGKGQTIAILIDTAPLAADTAFFWNKNGLPNDPARVEVVNVKGEELPPVEGEESMDVQWASGIAPEAKVRVYAAGSLGFVDLDRALDRIVQDAGTEKGLRQLSISLGLGEQLLSPDGQNDGEIQIENQKFLQLAALGVNVFVSSGDGGSNPDQFGHAGGTQQVEWMASCPFVVGVGGTALRLNGTGAIASEVGWAGSGGGPSKVFPRPPYQQIAGMPDGDRRLVPDVCLVAAPETGAYVRLSGQDQQIGGTSLSAPIWAGFCALMNDARSRNGKDPLPFLNPIIYPLSATPCFRDIGGNISNGNFKSVPGYDMVTGIGVPHVGNLIGKVNAMP